MTATLVVDDAGHACVQDLGRHGYADFGIPVNGAADQHSARSANILAGNAETAPLIEVTGSRLSFTADSDLLLAVTGAADRVLVDGHDHPLWQTLAVFAGARVTVPYATVGYRSYVAVNGMIEADNTMGSVAPDPLLGLGRRLARGDRLVVHTSYRGHERWWNTPLFRFPAAPRALSSLLRVSALSGPEIARIRGGAGTLSRPYRVSPQSDHIGLRLNGPTIEQHSSQEILSRGVPVGAVEVPPTGGLIILLRGRMVTAGYPVVAVVTTASLDVLGQARPGDDVVITLTDPDDAIATMGQLACARVQLTQRVHNAFTSLGLPAGPS